MPLFGSSGTQTKYRYSVMFTLACDPDTKVHDIKGTFELEGNETTADAQSKVIEQYLKDEGIRDAHPIQIIRPFRYW